MANLSGYNTLLPRQQTKRMIRRAILKAVAIPGYQVPFGGREMPMPYGWELVVSAYRQRDWRKRRVEVIDGADDTANAVSIQLL